MKLPANTRDRFDNSSAVVRCCAAGAAVPPALNSPTARIIRVTVNVLLTGIDRDRKCRKLNRVRPQRNLSLLKLALILWNILERYLLKDQTRDAKTKNKK